MHDNAPDWTSAISPQSPSTRKHYPERVFRSCRTWASYERTSTQDEAEPIQWQRMVEGTPAVEHPSHWLLGYHELFSLGYRHVHWPVENAFRERFLCGIASRRARRRVGIHMLQALRHVSFIRYILTDVWFEAVPARCAVSLIYESKLYT